MARVLAAGDHFGSVLHRSIHGGAVLSESAHIHGQRLPVHEHRAAYFSLNLRGEYTERVGSAQMDYRPFAVGFHPAGVRHHDRIGDGGARFFFIDVSDEWVDRWNGEFDRALECEPRVLGAKNALLAVRLFALFHAHALRLEFVDEAVSELLVEAGSVAIVAERRRPVWLRRCVEILHASIEEPITLANVARALDLHPVYVSREFRRWQGCGVAMFAQRLRIQIACRALATSNQRLAEIAASNGFADQSHFARVFRAALGVAPGQFRALLRSDERSEQSATLSPVSRQILRPR